jgi:hypothetical protein
MSVRYGEQSESHSDYVVTVTVRFDTPGRERCIADALMARPEVATVRIEYAPEPSVCRLDAAGRTRADAEAAARAVVERAAAGVGAVCGVVSAVALSTREWRTRSPDPAYGPPAG